LYDKVLRADSLTQKEGEEMKAFRFGPTMLLGMALGLGVVADLLLREIPWGINAPLWGLVFAGVILILQRSSTARLIGGWEIALAVVLLCSAAIAWRDAPMLAVFDFFAAAAGGILLLMRTPQMDLRRVQIADLIVGTISSLLDAILGAAGLIFADLKTDIPRAGQKGEKGLQLIRGSLLALPLILLFGSLFVAADAMFEHLVLEVLNIDFAELFFHLFTIAIVTWVLGGILRERFIGGTRAWSIQTPRKGFSLGFTEIAIVLGSVVFLSLAFVLTQFVYLFGGTAYVLGENALTVAEYARRGFFELVVVAGLTLPVLLLAEWILRKGDPAHERWFRILAGAQLVLLLIIMASAMHRLTLYQMEFGLTQQRVYASTVLLWLGVVFIWFALTVLRGKRDRFAFGAFASGVALLLLLHLVNPDDLIVSTNVARYREGKELDARYIRTLSADAVPRLVNSLSSIPEPERGKVAARLLKIRDHLEEDDWRTWNISRSRALSLLEEHRDRLEKEAEGWTDSRNQQKR
jgi:hypothetical protein